MKVLRFFIGHVHWSKPESQLHVARKHAQVDIQTLCELINALFTHKKHNTLQDRLQRAGKKSVTAETLLAMRRSVLLERDLFKEFLHWAVPRWGARELESVEAKLEIVGVHNVQILHLMLDRRLTVVHENDMKTLRSFGMTEFKLDTLEAFLKRATMAVDSYQMEVNLHTLADGLLASLRLPASTTARVECGDGCSVIRAIRQKKLLD